VNTYIKSVWKNTLCRVHADGAIYPNRTSENTAELDDDSSSNDRIVNPDSALKVVDERVGWVEQRETHRINDWLRWVSAIASTHPTVSSVFHDLIQFSLVPKL